MDQQQNAIPLAVFKQLGIENEVECYLVNNSLVIRPVREPQHNFAVDILKDLVGQGFSGDELIEKFKVVNAQIRPAVERMLAEGERIARASTKSREEATRELFGEDSSATTKLGIEETDNQFRVATFEELEAVKDKFDAKHSKMLRRLADS